MHIYCTRFSDILAFNSNNTISVLLWRELTWGTFFLSLPLCQSYLHLWKALITTALPNHIEAFIRLRFLSVAPYILNSRCENKTYKYGKIFIRWTTRIAEAFTVKVIPYEKVFHTSSQGFDKLITDVRHLWSWDLKQDIDDKWLAANRLFLHQATCKSQIMTVLFFLSTSLSF